MSLKPDFVCINCGTQFTSESHYVTQSVECLRISVNVHAPHAMDDGGSTLSLSPMLPPLPMFMKNKGDYLQAEDDGGSGSDSSSMLPPLPSLPLSNGPGNETYLLSLLLQENAQAPLGPSGLESCQLDNNSLLEWFKQICCCCCCSTTN